MSNQSTTSREETMIERIVRERDLTALEAWAIRQGSYAKAIEVAKASGVDLGELEELLEEI